MENSLARQTENVLNEIISQMKKPQGAVLLIGCSTSEVTGANIGTGGSPEAAREMIDVMFRLADAHGFFLAFQCCEHLNRSVLVERKLKEIKNLEEVNAIPTRVAGGAIAEAAYEKFHDPCLTEEIKADFGLDIGLTLIGMNLKKVAVPVRLSHNRIGQAAIVFAKTRPKYVGGERATYNIDLK